MFKNNVFPKIVLACLTLLLVIIAWWLVPAPALPQDQSRINALEVDINGIESRLNRIEAQLNQRRGGAPVPPPAINSGRNRQPQTREQMFERLATLVIELKQQVNKLETRVSKLESR